MRAQREPDIATAFDTPRDRSGKQIARDVFMALARAYERHRLPKTIVPHPASS